MSTKRKTVAVSGGFDPIHIGHVRMFKEAAKLGDLVVILNNDAWLKDKKGFVFMGQQERAEIIRAFPFVTKVVITEHKKGDADRSVCRELAKVKPDIFANGGDRKNAKDIPEAKLCKEIGITMRFNIGAGGKVQSSSWLTANMPKSKVTPWGHMETYRTEKGWWIKTLTINPGQRISLQKHFKRGEVWVCVEGEFQLEIGPSQRVHRLTQYGVYQIGKEVMHRISNRSRKPATLVEVALGPAFEEDIKRIEDDYGRI